MMRLYSPDGAAVSSAAISRWSGATAGDFLCSGREQQFSCAPAHRAACY